MVPFQLRDLSTICNYAKVKYEERVETKRRRSNRRRSASDPTMMSSTSATRRKPQTYGKLHKPPKVESLHERPERPRNKLQKRCPPSVVNAVTPPVNFFTLEYDPYPYNTQPSQFLGIYSSMDTVTAGAFRHGAYTFSREGMLDGSEYLSPTGRIKIASHTVQSTGVTAVVPDDKSQKFNNGVMRLDIPHPNSQPVAQFGSQQDLSKKEVSKDTVFLALHEGPKSAYCIGVFTNKTLAWGACLKDKAWLEWSDPLTEEERSVEENDMPRVSARLVGSGRHAWFVRAFEVDGS